MNDLEFLDLGEIIQQSKTPYLFVHGQNDPAVILPEGDYMGELPKTAHFIEFEDCGHFPMLDETEKFNRLVTDFYSLASGESPRQLQLKEAWKRRMR
ncbi:MAG: alpha/beta hydrolase [Anaerolineales bacterium]|nr:alpha/beta hydrolase [Anaerolineales bacterium]